MAKQGPDLSKGREKNGEPRAPPGPGGWSDSLAGQTMPLGAGRYSPRFAFAGSRSRMYCACLPPRSLRARVYI